MKDFFTDLKERLVKAIELDFTNIKKMIGNEKMYAVSLVTDSDTVSLFLAVNTNEFLAKKDDEEDTQDNALFAQFAEYFLEKIDLLDAYNTKWIPSEWGYSNNDLIHSEIALIVPKLFEKGTTIDSQELPLFQRLFFECLTSALQTLIIKGIFSDNNQAITIFISISDDERTEEIENFSAEILNSEEIYNKFCQRYN